MKPIYGRLLELLEGNPRLALATIIATEGSAPQVPGASAVFSETGLLKGTVGGGLLEAAAAKEAVLSLRDGQPRLMEFRLDAEPYDEEGAVCGGSARVLIDPFIHEEKAVFSLAVEALGRREAGVLLTVIRPLQDTRVSVSRIWLPADALKINAALPPEAGAGEFRGSILGNEPRLAEEKDVLFYSEPVTPPPRLIIAGAGHVGKEISRLGNLLDFEVSVIDDRPEYACRDNLPEADRIIVGDIAGTIRGLPESPEDYFVIVTRGHRHDGEALKACFGRSAAYVGMIGSRNKVALMRSEFLERGWASEEQWAAVHAPIGLPIRSRTVEEIAVSVAAELVLARAERRGEPGR